MLSQKIVRVDSTMIAETSAKLLAGMCVGRKKDGRKQTRYTIAFDGIFPCSVEVFSDKSDLSEVRTIPKVVFSCVERHKGNQYLFLTNIFDLLPEVIILFYRKRWSIEVFIRFLKQELNLSHFFSTKANGIKIIFNFIYDVDFINAYFDIQTQK